MSTAKSQDSLIIAATAALTARQGTWPRDYGRGYWDGQPDFRTGYSTVYGAVVQRENEEGTAWARLRHVATGTCPSGPCGCRSEIGTWYIPKSRPDIPIGTVLESIHRPWGGKHVTLEPVNSLGKVKARTWVGGVEEILVAEFRVLGSYRDSLVASGYNAETVAANLERAGLPLTPEEDELFAGARWRRRTASPAVSA